MTETAAARQRSVAIPARPALCNDESVQFADAQLDLSRAFLPEALVGLATVRGLDDDARREMNQIRAVSYLHLFELFETSLADAASGHVARDDAARATLGSLLRAPPAHSKELFGGFIRAFEQSFPVTPKLIARPPELDAVLFEATSLSLLTVALHLKLVTQQHYLACLRGDEELEPGFVNVLKEHWELECGRSKRESALLAIQHALSTATPASSAAALRDYRHIVFGWDGVLRRQAVLDVMTLETVRGRSFSPTERKAVLTAQFAASRKTFITFGIVNAAFVYAMRNLGPTAPAMLARVVSELSSR